MRLSFDLDGVVADTSNSMLGLLHRAARDGLPGADIDLQQYYARAKIALDPREFCLPGDEFFIITGRVPTAHAITGDWVLRWFGPAALDDLYLIGNGASEELLLNGKDEEASELLAQGKLRAIQTACADVHFDNNPVIVRRLREAGVRTVMVGGGLL